MISFFFFSLFVIVSYELQTRFTLCVCVCVCVYTQIYSIAEFIHFYSFSVFKCGPDLELKLLNRMASVEAMSRLQGCELSIHCPGENTRITPPFPTPADGSITV